MDLGSVSLAVTLLVDPAATFLVSAGMIVVVVVVLDPNSGFSMAIVEAVAAVVFVEGLGAQVLLASSGDRGNRHQEGHPY